MLLLVTNSLIFRELCGQERCPDKGASCGCVQVLVFFVPNFFLASQNGTIKVGADPGVKGKEFTASTRIISTCSVVFLVLGRPEHLPSSADILSDAI
jgi:hypothetical protein